APDQRGNAPSFLGFEKSKGIYATVRPLAIQVEIVGKPYCSKRAGDAHLGLKAALGKPGTSGRGALLGAGAELHPELTVSLSCGESHGRVKHQICEGHKVCPGHSRKR